MFFDPLYLIIIAPTALFALWAQLKVKTAFTRWSQEPNTIGMTGADAAAAMLRNAGLNLRIEEHAGFLSDHYDPRDRTLRLSPDVYHGRSVAALGVACHEAGHALQHAEGYAALQFRNAVVPFASIGSWLSWPLIAIGLLMQSFQLAVLGIIVFSAVVVFQLITLPVEFDASNRAKRQLAAMNLLRSRHEVQGVAATLNAAAMTYVAATVTALAQLLYFIIRAGALSRRD